MSSFVEKPANKISISLRKSLYGVGINDSDYVTSPVVRGSQVVCPYYQVWVNMLERCYSDKYQKRWPTYRGCTVADEWLLFSNFKKWMKTKYWEGMCLDKDILIPDNKIYSAESCVFIDQHTNKLLNNQTAQRGKHPKGVCLHKRKKLFQADLRINGKKKFLGLYKTPEEAEAAYKAAKADEIERVAQLQLNPLAKHALLLRAYKLRSAV